MCPTQPRLVAMSAGIQVEEACEATVNSPHVAEGGLKTLKASLVCRGSIHHVPELFQTLTPCVEQTTQAPAGLASEQVEVVDES